MRAGLGLRLRWAEKGTEAAIDRQRGTEAEAAILAGEIGITRHQSTRVGHLVELVALGALLFLAHKLATVLTAAAVVYRRHIINVPLRWF